MCSKSMTDDTPELLFVSSQCRACVVQVACCGSLVDLGLLRHLSATRLSVRPLSCVAFVFLVKATSRYLWKIYFGVDLEKSTQGSSPFRNFTARIALFRPECHGHTRRQAVIGRQKTTKPRLRYTMPNLVKISVPSTPVYRC